MSNQKECPLVVTTAHKGVFFGYGTPTNEETIRLVNARMAVYWPQEVHGVLGLAATGPLPGSRIGPSVPAIILRDVTAVIECSDPAAKLWENEPWK